MKFVLIFMIKIYQKTISPDHGWFRARFPYGYCRYYPSCSQYTIDSLREHGVTKGLWLALKRIIKCNPFSTPSVDLINK